MIRTTPHRPAGFYENTPVRTLDMSNVMTVKETTEYDNFLGKKDESVKPAALFEIEETEESEREKLWVGMPEFEQKDKPPFKTIYLHFRNKEDFDQFVEKYATVDDEQTITPKTKSMWYPHLDKDENSLKRWFEE